MKVQAKVSLVGPQAVDRPQSSSRHHLDEAIERLKAGATTFAAGLRHAAEMALLTALQIELRPDANQIRQRAAIEALRGFAEGLKAASVNEFSPASNLYFQASPPEPEAIASTYEKYVL